MPSMHENSGLATGKLSAEPAVQLRQPRLIGGGVRLVIGSVRRVFPCKTCSYVLHHFLRISDAEPDVGVETATFSRSGAMVMNMPVVIGHRHESGTISCIHHRLASTVDPLQQFYRPRLHEPVGENEQVRPVNIHHILRLRLKAVRLQPRWQQQLHLRLVPPHLAGKIVQGEQCHHHVQLVRPLLPFRPFAGSRQSNQQAEQEEHRFPSHSATSISSDSCRSTQALHRPFT